MPEVSVVMATFNRHAELRRCLSAIANQSTEAAIQVCIVNDGGASISSVVESFPDLHISFQDARENRGQVAARNAALILAEGEYVAFCDDDDRWLPTHISSLLKVMQSNTEVWAYCDAELVQMRHVNGKRRLIGRRDFAWLDAPSMLRRYNPIIPSASMYRHDVHRDIGTYDASVGHYWDWDWWLRLLELSRPLRVPRCEILYAMDEGGSNLSSDPGRMRPDLLRLVEKHRLGVLPSMNFLGMLEAPELDRETATTARIWDGKMEIWE